MVDSGCHKLHLVLESLGKAAGDCDEAAARALFTTYKIDARASFAIAVVGPSGVGKSALINLVTGANRNDPFFAPLNVRQREYAPAVVAWHALNLIDLPELKPAESAEEYIRQYHLLQMDLVLFVGHHGRITASDRHLLEVLGQAKAPLVYVNTKTDLSCANYRLDEDIPEYISDAKVFEMLRRMWLSTPPLALLNALNIPLCCTDTSAKKAPGFAYDNQMCLEAIVRFLKPRWRKRTWDEVEATDKEVIPTLLGLRTSSPPQSARPEVIKAPMLRIAVDRSFPMVTKSVSTNYSPLPSIRQMPTISPLLPPPMAAAIPPPSSIVLPSLRGFQPPTKKALFQPPCAPMDPPAPYFMAPPTSQHVSSPVSTSSDCASSTNGDGKTQVNPGKWTPDEDDLLRQAVDKFGPRNWKAIAKHVGRRNHAQCLQRWRKVLFPGLRRGNWSHEEDCLLQSQIAVLSQQGGKLNWASVAAGVPGRTAKHCQERWRNYLNPSIKRGPFDADEKEKLTELYNLWGNQWTRISEAIPGRCPVDCKTTWQNLNPNFKQSDRPGPGRPKRFGTLADTGFKL
ncbi:myb-like DNA-binding protein [Achlya hypogyna]|uniref:Myb-like DNA-binding protein n=1 Tax=Achlya hypogyna TaxID=1202772 RepID=A0A1V9ZGB8_ACHHY|nr:myb-like DNA-binding protein [Achlya hypogyna]